MKVCSHCKTQNNDSANYCRQCGFVFPDVNLQSGNIDNSLIDKVNELQKRVSDAEVNSNNSQREINTLNSRVSSLVSSNSSLQNRLTQTERSLASANSTINSERQKAKNAQKEADEAKKSLSEAESSKSTLHAFYLISLIALGITALVQCIGKSTLSGIVEKVSGNTPLIVSSVEIRDASTSYGATIYSKNTTYLYPRITAYSLVDGSQKVYVKLYTPYGLSTGNSSPSGYSYDYTIYPSKNQTGTYELSGWGNNDKGNWASGSYRVEIWCKGKCIGTKSFTIY